LEFTLPFTEKEEVFSHPELIFDSAYFEQYKVHDKNYHDISAVIYSYEYDISNEKKEKNKVMQSSILYSGFKVILNPNSNLEYKIKPDTQKLFVRGHWYEMVDIYGMSLNPNKYDTIK
jgi:hypothetical protein